MSDLAGMTVGTDVSSLFPDVLKNMQTEDIEQKKLVYLYVVDYAKTQPDLVILAVNTHPHYALYTRRKDHRPPRWFTRQRPYPAIFTLTPTILNKLLIVLNECFKWGRVAILSALARYQFQHVNGSVVLAAVRVTMIHMRKVPREDFNKQLIRKMAPPLVTLLSSPPEVYNDSYFKVEKVGHRDSLSNENNVDALLSELKKYASEVDVDFVRRSIKAVGQAAVNIEASAERRVNVLLDLIATRFSYVVQEAVVVMKIENADELLSVFAVTYTEESYSVQLQTLTAVVKLFLYKPGSSQGLVQHVLNTSTKNTKGLSESFPNLLDFDGEPAQEGSTGLAATQVLQQPAAKNITSGTSTNPLDDPVSIFGNTSLSSSGAPILLVAAHAIDALGGFGGVSPATVVPSTTSNQQDDLLGVF
ncbi:armadillo-type protein [Russula vinacea]|nr:armadillo-type protein [Russula vinacea]